MSDEKIIKKYENVKTKNSQFGKNVIIGESTYVADSIVGDFVLLERRNIIKNSFIGDYSFTGYNTVIKHAEIGKFCAISWNSSIGGGDHDYTHLSIHSFPFIDMFGFTDEKGGWQSYDIPLKIGNDVWIAANTCITRGTTIGDGAIVSAGAVVTKDILPYEIWGGVPARKIGQRFSDEIIEELLKLKWWDLPNEIIKDNLSVFKKDVTKENLADIKEKLSS